MKKINKPLLSVVIPAYNEEDNFKRGALIEVLDFIKKQKYPSEIILVDDGSRDNTFKLLKNFASKNKNFRALSIKHGGKAQAVKAGVMAAKGEYVLFTDFDQSTPIIEVNKVLREFKRGADLVIPYRARRKDAKLTSTLRSVGFNIATQIILLPGIKDTQCGFKAFKTEIAKKLFSKLQVTGKKQKGSYMGAFDVELLFWAKKYKYKIHVVPVSWRLFESKRLTFKEPFMMLRDVCILRIKDIKGEYKI